MKKWKYFYLFIYLFTAAIKKDAEMVKVQEKGINKKVEVGKYKTKTEARHPDIKIQAHQYLCLSLSISILLPLDPLCLKYK